MTVDASNRWSMEPGQALGPWRIVEPLGMGSFAEVYKAQHELTPRRLAAIKILRPSRVGSDEIRRRFLQEADCLSELDNSNVVKFYDAAQTPDGRIWLAMEYLVGQSLYDLFASCLAAHGAFDIPRALMIGVSIANGVQAAHAIGLIHRDLKEENIFITTDNSVKVLDFGIAKLKNPELSGRAKSTAANVILGTLTHLAPEQINGGRASVQSDVYSLGVILYTLITGRHPFLVAGEDGADAQDIALRILMATPPSPHSLAPQVTPEVEFLLLTALAKRPEHRYPSMTDFSVAMVMAFHNYKKGILPPGYTAEALHGALERATFRTAAVGESLSTATSATQGSYDSSLRGAALPCAPPLRRYRRGSAWRRRSPSRSRWRWWSAPTG